MTRLHERIISCLRNQVTIFIEMNICGASSMLVREKSIAIAHCVHKQRPHGALWHGYGQDLWHPRRRNVSKKSFFVVYSKKSDDNDSFADVRRWLGMEGSSPDRSQTTPNQNQYPILNSVDETYNPTEPKNESVKSSSVDRKRASAIEEWSSSVGDDWDEWSGTPIVADLDDSEELAELREAVIRRRRSRRGERSKVRDEYLRPIVDATGIYNRVALGEKEAEERVFVEAITNQYESREALRYLGVLLGIPLAIGFAVSNIVAKPLWAYAQKIDPNAFALTDEQKIAGAEAMHREEVKIRLTASLGQAPDLKDEEILQELHHEAIAFAEHMKEENKRALLNVVSDSTSATVFFLLLLRDNSPRAILFRTIGRVFTGLSGEQHYVMYYILQSWSSVTLSMHCSPQILQKHS